MSDSEITAVKVHVARIDERTERMVDDFKRHIDHEDKYQEAIAEQLTTLAEKVGSQNLLIQSFNSDKRWVIGIFTVAYAALLVWVEHKLGK
jgi:hypothetical protein